MSLNKKPMYAGLLQLSRNDMVALRITDPYSVHRVVYDLYSDVRTDSQKNASVSSGILYVDKSNGDEFKNGSDRIILLLSDRPPNTSPEFGMVTAHPIADDFLDHPQYKFSVFINPSKKDIRSGKLIAMRTRESVFDWFVSRTEKAWGFNVNQETLQIENVSVQQFQKEGKTVTHGSALIKGSLTVTNKDQFMHSFTHGIGRGRAFGFGLLQIAPY